MSALKVINESVILDQEVVKIFVESVIKTISVMARTPIKSLEPKYIYQFKFNSEIAGVVGISSHEEKGILILSFEKNSLLKIYNNMMNENIEELNPTAIDLVGELTNMVYGAARTSLNYMGYHFEMSIPTVINGSFQLTKKSLSPSVIVPFEIEGVGKLSVALSVE